MQHYADGARLIGLTDAQLFKQLKLLQSHQNDQNLDDKEAQSPYAKSFHVGLLRSLMRDRARKCPVKPFQLGGPKIQVRKHMRNIPVHKISSVANRIKIRVVGIEGASTRQAPFRSPVLGYVLYLIIFLKITLVLQSISKHEGTEKVNCSNSSSARSKSSYSAFTRYILNYKYTVC